MRELEDYKVGEFVLTLDLLGVGERMSDRAEWLAPFRDMLNMIRDAVHNTTNIAAPEESQRLFQYGDTIVFPSDNPQQLVSLGMRLLTQATLSNMLAQASIAGGGAFYITDPSGFGSQWPLQPNAELQCLVGAAVARSHVILKGVRGPRLLIDEESTSIPQNTSVWRRYTGPARHVAKDDAIKASEVEWWTGFIGDEPETRVQHGLRLTNAAIADGERDIAAVPPVGEPVIVRRQIQSLKKRREHLLAFLAMLRDEPLLTS